jgi:transposase
VSKDSGSLPPTRDLLYRSVYRLRRSDSCGAAPSDQQVGAENPSHRTFQQHAAAAGCPSGARDIVIFQEARQSYRCQQPVYLPLHPDESCGIERALHGYHYPGKGFRVVPHRWVVERTFAGLLNYRRHRCDYAVLTATAEAMIQISMVHLILPRLA